MFKYALVNNNVKIGDQESSIEIQHHNLIPISEGANIENGSVYEDGEFTPPSVG